MEMPTEMLEELHTLLRRHNAADREPEPGPQSARKFFSPKDLILRWGWSRTKVYEIPADELPAWKRGGIKRFFWAHVWAYEGRMSWEEAERYYRDFNAIQAV